MATFTEEQQKTHREAFIKECHQKAWGAACNADYIAKSLDELTAEFTKLQEQDRKLEEETNQLANAIDSHNKDNRDKRKAIQEQRNSLTRTMEMVSQNMQRGQMTLQSLYQSVETNLALAKHAKAWNWREVNSQA